MGRDTLVKEFKGRHDHKDYIKRGIRTENLFIDEAIKLGYRIKVASDSQNMSDHIDLILTKGDETFTVDIKARRTGTDKSKGFDDLWTVVEFKNTMGNPGWLYGKCDYFVFEQEDEYVFANSEELRKLCHEVVDLTDKVKYFREANYKVWGRSYQNKQDLISRIEMSKVLQLKSTFNWKKSLDFSTRVCDNSILTTIKDNNMSVIKGNAHWASITSPNTTFDSDGVWTIDVGNLDEKNKKIAQADGISVKNKNDDRGDFVTIKRKVRRKDGNLNKAPEVVDAQKRAMIGTLIGNGSEVNVLYSTYEWEFGGKSGVSADLRAIQVTNLVPYNTDADADAAFGVVEDGFVSKEADEEVSFAS